MKNKRIYVLLTFVLIFFVACVGCNKQTGNYEKKSASADITKLIDYKMNKSGDEFTLTIKDDEDFVILNLTDIQLDLDSWLKKDDKYDVAKRIMTYLVETAQPDLITFTGDMCYGQPMAYQKAVELFDSFGIYWAPVFGNHDHNQNSEKSIAEIYNSAKHCLFEAGDPELGAGNYIIKLVDLNDRLREMLIFMDTHDMVDGNWAYLTEKQLAWYEGKIKKYCTETIKVDSTVFIHIPIYAYNYALKEALNCNEPYRSDAFYAFCEDMPVNNFGNKTYWKDGFTESFGVCWEGVCSPVSDEGAFDLFKELGSTHNVVSGHDHNNNFSILYEGIRLTYGTKSSYGCYYKEPLIGGTVLTVDETGINNLFHVYWKK